MSSSSVGSASRPEPGSPASGECSGEAAAALLKHRVPGSMDGLAFDELCAQDQLRPAWANFARQWVEPAGQRSWAADLDLRRQQVQQRLRADGVTHNVHSGTELAAAGARAPAGLAAARPWSLELLPLLIEPADWAQICAGVRQRCTVLELMLADVYGPQHVLRSGLLPPALVQRHPGWLRPLMGHRPPAGMHLHVVALDLARREDGCWWVAAQRTQGPSGLGYVLHNRLVISGQFAQAFKALQVQRIASTYRAMLDTLEQQAAQVAGSGETPRLVLLTPGPYSETYFEHAYLARYLGLPLVEGGDLTVRHDRLFLKTVDGLQPVHGMVRRLDDDWCDPLELRADSSLGVPGLLQAARSGSVVISNALGSGFAESPAFQAYMQPLARHFLGQDLLLPSAPSWWCGDAAALKQGLARRADHGPASQRLRSTYPRGGQPAPVDLDEALAEDPDAVTLQSPWPLSRAPVWGESTLWQRPAMVRVYAIADGHGGWQLLPGGMTRVASGPSSGISMRHGGASLDTWVLSEAPLTDHYSMLRGGTQVADLSQRSRPVSSRTGENLFWLGRYTERTEQQLRLARALLMQREVEAPAAVLQALSSLALRAGLAPMGVPTLLQSATLFERAVLASLADPQAAQGANSIGFHLAALARSALALRDRLSTEQWGLVHRMGDDFQQALEPPASGGMPTAAQVAGALDSLGLHLAAITGMQTDRMTRDHGWRLLAVGRLIERLQAVAQRLEVFMHLPVVGHAAGAELLLDLLDSLITFRARYQRHEDLLALADLLVFDPTNPRALAGILRRLRTELGKLPGAASGRQALLALIPPQGVGLELGDLQGLEEAPIAARLQNVASELHQSGLALADGVGERYFALARGADQSV